MVNILNCIYNLIQIRIHNVCFGENIKINGRIHIHGNGKIIIGNNVIINSSINANPSSGGTSTHFCVGDGAILEIGNNVGISNSAITAKKKIIIEDDVLIGDNCMISDNDFHSLDYEKRMMRPDPGVAIQPVILKKGSFIGARSIILKGTTIGERSIAGAGSVVTKNIPDNEIWAGNPAKKIKELANSFLKRENNI